MDQETKRMDVCPTKKISRIRLLFPVYVETSKTTSAKTLGTPASAIAFKAATATVFSSFINHMGAGSP